MTMARGVDGDTAAVTETTEDVAERIVAEVLDEFHGRSGIGNELEMIEDDDPVIYAELRGELVRRVSAVLDKRT